MGDATCYDLCTVCIPTLEHGNEKKQEADGRGIKAIYGAASRTLQDIFAFIGVYLRTYPIGLFS
ncbi:hypothetical protein CODIS_35200 [Candidatus Thiodiazotropha endolucinida]|uniref:Uncharacterized protein n=1 Tax=Candidatus Thiodiazotropha endolucinida TaxID=1655433 RepID=A0A7Z1AEM1_9GAMM|nr:hypothetical protein CODIS_35200 [Candidatus Thiodiazotropha endolucinida]